MNRFKFKKDNQNLLKMVLLKKMCNKPPLSTQLLVEKIFQYCCDREKVILTHGMIFLAQGFATSFREAVKNPEVFQILANDDENFKKLNLNPNSDEDIGEELQIKWAKYLKKQLEIIFQASDSSTIKYDISFLVMVLNVPRELEFEWIEDRFLKNRGKHLKTSNSGNMKIMS